MEEQKLTLKNIDWVKLVCYMFLIGTVPLIIIYFGAKIIEIGVRYNSASLAGETVPMTNETIAFLILLSLGIQIVFFGLVYLNLNTLLYPFTKKDILKSNDEVK